jgi:hypothetical protein
MVLAAPGAGARSLVLLIQPSPWGEIGAVSDPAPFATLVEHVLGVSVRVRVSDDTLSHWQAVRSAPDYDLAFDEAHFVGYRIRRHGFSVVVRDAADMRFAVLVRPRTPVTSPSDLVARQVAVPEPPSLAVVRLLALFPGAAREPRLVVMPSRAAALAALLRGEVTGALVTLNDAVSPEHGPAEVGLVTDVSPGRALSAGPAVSVAMRGALAAALVAAGTSPRGRRALAGVGAGSLEWASDATYEGSGRLLRGTWGYR